MIDVIDRLASQNPRFRKEAFYYVAKAIESAHETIRKAESIRRHISGKELVDEIIRLALDEFGFLGAAVFSDWGIRDTMDFGEIVFIMVENGVLSAQPTDTRDDFRNLYNFETVFEREYAGFEMKA